MRKQLIQKYTNDGSVKIKQINRLTKKDQKKIALRAFDCAECVLSYFEEKYPHDDRPRKAIEAGRAWARGEITINQVRISAFAAHAAARDAKEPAAIAAARSAGHAAATAHVSGHARYAATHAAKAEIAASDNLLSYD